MKMIEEVGSMTAGRTVRVWMMGSLVPIATFTAVMMSIGIVAGVFMENVWITVGALLCSGVVSLMVMATYAVILVVFRALNGIMIGSALSALLYTREQAAKDLVEAGVLWGSVE